MGILKPVRKLLIQFIAERMGLSPENHSVVDIIDDDCRPEDVLPQVEDWLDENEPGTVRRWSDIGYKTYNEAEHFQEMLEEEYSKYQERDE